jgi:hypothetical protein
VALVTSIRIFAVDGFNDHFIDRDKIKLKYILFAKDLSLKRLPCPPLYGLKPERWNCPP